MTLITSELEELFQIEVTMKILQILVLVLGLAVVGNAQLECYWGIEVYVRDNAGNEIKNNKAELTISENSKWFDLPYEFRNNHHLWTNGTAHGIPTINYSLKVSADGYKDFEKQINMPQCGIRVFELRLQPEDSDKEAIFERLMRLRIFTQNVNDEQVQKIRIIDDKGKQFESGEKYGEYQFDVKSGSYSLQLVKSDGSIITDFKELKFEERTIILKIILSSDEQANEQKKELVCEYPKNDLNGWIICDLTIRDSKFDFLTHFTGKVSTESGEALSGTKIIIKDKSGKTFQTIAKDGKFAIELPVGNYKVEFTQDGDSYPNRFLPTRLEQKLSMGSNFIDVVIKKN